MGSRLLDRTWEHSVLVEEYVPALERKTSDNNYGIRNSCAEIDLLERASLQR
jgi:hypothetical protein